MTGSALVVGGTGPTGPLLVDGLLARGFDVSVFHRGTHEVPELADVEHLHGDPHFAESIADTLAGREWDVVVATYGRTRLVAEGVAGRCGQFVGVGGSAVYAGWVEPARRWPHGMRVLAREDDELAPSPADPSPAEVFAGKLVGTERTVFDLHRRDAFDATWFRYPRIYGPRNVQPYEWSVLRRIRDGRPFVVLHDGGLQLRTRCSVWNAAHALLLAVDHPAAAAGEVFNVGEDRQFSERQWAELVTQLAGGELEIVLLPAEISSPSWHVTPFAGTASPHCLFDTTKLRERLGYRDVVGTEEALARTLAWLERNPVTPEAYPAFQDAFDYAHEDRLVAAWRDAVTQVLAEAGAAPERRPTHAYAHPKQAGAAVDERGR